VASPLVLSAQDSGAHVSACSRYRYRLWRSWGPGPSLAYVMLNPSTADASKDDPTIRKCIGFAKRNGFDGIEVVNLFAWRATEPRDLLRAMDAGDLIVGPENNLTTMDVINRAATIVAAWGVVPSARLRWRADDVLATLKRYAQDRLWHLGLTRDKHPRHPLMTGYRDLERWR
jgi:hypothetical protein